MSDNPKVIIIQPDMMPTLSLSNVKILINQAVMIVRSLEAGGYYLQFDFQKAVEDAVTERLRNLNGKDVTNETRRSRYL